MNASEYQRLARRTQNPDVTLHEMKLHALHGLASEVGEIHGIYQKMYQGHPVKVSELIGEIGDLCWFVAELCDVLRLDLGEVMEANIDKLRQRYPEGFDAVRSLNREREDNGMEDDRRDAEFGAVPPETAGHR
jgi:NTP pyrophosphatase (non-canonical NTP hydrolase)